MKPLPPLNYAIWVTTTKMWFRIRVMYMSESALVYKNLSQNAEDSDIVCPCPFNAVFCDWKITLDGTENNVFR